MPSIGTYLTDEILPIVEKAAADSAEKKVSPYIAEAVRQRLAAEGHLPGTPAHDIRAEALAAAEVVGPEQVLAALRALSTGTYVTPRAV